jgi:hypothetical protein
MKLEKIIINNLEGFNTDEPSDSHFERFRSKLERSGKQSEKRLYRTVCKIAAVLIIIVISAWIIRLIYYNIDEGRIESVSQISSELCEAEEYYKYQINNKYEIIRKLNFNDKGERKSIISELKDMDSDYRELKKDLEQNPYDERVINAVIGYYMVKLESMDRIITQAKKNNL